MNEHKHAWALRLIADGVPLNEFECKLNGNNHFGEVLSATFVCRPDDYEIRRKQRTHVVNGFTVVASEQVPPATGTHYYVPDGTQSNWASRWWWSQDGTDDMFLSRGLVFLDKEAAIMNAKAMCGIDPSK
jgi:hypothetical protein